MSGRVDLDAEPVIKWLDEGEAWLKRGRELFSSGYSGEATGKQGSEKKAWESEPASERQLSFLKKHGINPKSDLSKGDASTLIDSIIKKEKTKP